MKHERFLPVHTKSEAVLGMGRVVPNAHSTNHCKVEDHETLARQA